MTSDDLHERLDALWQDYLQALDQYTSSQDELSKLLSSGYFELAQANARRTGGRRYGRDWYDERTKATIRATITTGDANLDLPVLSLSEIPVYLETDEVSRDLKKTEHQDSTTDEATLLTPAATPEPETSAAPRPVETKKTQPDPASWFGLFVAPSLRKTQSTFKAAVLGPSMVEEDAGSALQTAVSASRRMRAIEVEIRAVRKALRRAVDQSKS